MRFIHRVPVLCALALCLSTTAFAQRVTVLPIDGDSGKLRRDIEKALIRARGIDLVTPSRYDAAASKHGLSDVQAGTGEGLAAVASELKLDAGVGGSVSGKTFHAQVFGPAGGVLWSSELRLSKGGLAAKDLRAIVNGTRAGKGGTKTADSGSTLPLRAVRPTTSRSPMR